MRLFGLLFCFLLCLYLATSSGHTSSNDEDEMYYVTQGIVERGSPALPRDEAMALSIPRGAARAADGNYYSPYGPLQSVLAIPFYLAGRGVAAAFDPRFETFVTHAAVTVVPALATAASAVVVASVAGQLGLHAAGATLLGLVYGAATIAWPYARYFWSEPLATLFVLLAAQCAIRGSRANSARSWLYASLFLGLAVATRTALAVAILPLAVYLCVGAFRCGRAAAPGRLIRQGAGIAAGFLIPAAAVGAYNLQRFGLAWEGGSGFGRSFAAASVVFGGDPIAGLQGLLLSPGKSVFLYSPPLLLALVGLPPFIRWAGREAVLLLGLAVVQVALVAPLLFWHGDAAWGPRYLVPAVPFLLMPAAVWFRMATPDAWRRTVLGVAAALGVIVQVLGVAVNYDTYVLTSGGPDGGGAQQRWFEPLASPLVAAPRQLLQRIALYGRSVGPGEYAFGTGFFELELPEQVLPRWSDGHAALAFRPPTADGGQVNLTLIQPELSGPRQAPDMTLLLDGNPIPQQQWQVTRTDPGHFVLHVPLPGALSGTLHRLELDSPVFIPAESEAGSTDSRRLGVRLLDVQFVFGPNPLALADVPVVPNLPVTVDQPWSRKAFTWFYEPSIPHLVDVWPWYAASSGLPQLLAAAVAVPLLALAWFGYRLVIRLRSEFQTNCPGYLGSAIFLVSATTLVAFVLGTAAASVSSNPSALRARTAEQSRLIRPLEGH